MKSIVKALIVLVLMGGLVCSSVSLAQAKYYSKTKSVKIEARLIDVKLDLDKKWYILYLENHKAAKVPPDRVTIKYSSYRTSTEPCVTVKGKEYYVEKYNEYDEAIFVFKDREEYLKYFGDIRNVKVVRKEKGSECFIATASYGTPLHEDLDVLRDFRDNTLKKNWLGQKFVDWYYENGPVMAEWVSKTELGKAAVRNLLIKPAVLVLKKIEK